MPELTPKPNERLNPRNIEDEIEALSGSDREFVKIYLQGYYAACQDISRSPRLHRPARDRVEDLGWRTHDMLIKLGVKFIPPCVELEAQDDDKDVK